MIIGGSKKQVIENIKKNTSLNELNQKVEVNDPNLSDEEIEKSLNKFYNDQKKISYGFNKILANKILNRFSKEIYKNIKILGLEKLENNNFSKGAIITSNHFNPLDSYAVRYVIEKKLNKKLYIVIQDSNLSMKGYIGFLMNNLDVIPISKNPNYIIKTFMPEMKKILAKGNIVLIYPEEEMWFNYCKPRPCKRGAYQFAHELDVPVISCFVKLNSTHENDNDEFYKVNYEIKINEVLYPNADLSAKKDSILMAQKDYDYKKQAYQDFYGKKLTYDFDLSDIAGYKKRD